MRKIIIMGIPHHGNLGDNAIAIAEEQMVERYFPEYEVVKLPEKNLIEYASSIIDDVNDEDVILLHGGGNIGDTYMVPEEGRRYIIETFKSNKIIIFPQTAYFDNKEELEKSRKIYNAHKDLIIMAREEKSYEFMRNTFNKCKVFLTPDIVMSLKKTMNLERKNVLFLFRQDKEQTLKSEEQDMIKNVITKKYGNYILTDMHLGEDVIDMEGTKRTTALSNKFTEFNRAKLVITDRLHGMIFAAITETPCVVFGSYTHKIVESYKWLKDLEYIKFGEDINDFEEKIDEVVSAKNRKYDNRFAENSISEILKNEIIGNN